VDERLLAKLDLLEKFIEEVYWEDCGLAVWDKPEYAGITLAAQSMNDFISWTDGLSEAEKTAADEITVALGNLPKYRWVTNEELERMVGII
jgi:hypothetical protein